LFFWNKKKKSTYESLFEKAIKRSDKYGLDKTNFNYNSSRLLSEDSDLDIIQKTINEEFGTNFPPELVVSQCMSFNYKIKEHLEKALGTNLYYTVGDVEMENGYRFFKCEDNKLKNLLNNGLPESKGVDLHVWFTTPSYEILDLTLGTTLAYTQHDKSYQSMNGRIIAQHIDDFKDGVKYIPYLIGEDFAHKSGALIDFSIL